MVEGADLLSYNGSVSKEAETIDETLLPNPLLAGSFSSEREPVLFVRAENSGITIKSLRFVRIIYYNGGVQMMRKKVKVILLTLLMCGVAACGNKDGNAVESGVTPDKEEDMQDVAPEIERDDPEVEVTEEDFMKEFGSVISVPDDIQILEYRIDSETRRGYMAFYKDDVLWNVYVKPVNNWPEVYRIYVDDNMTEIDPELAPGTVTKVHDTDPELHYYRIQYDENSGAYELFAKWILEDEGFQIALTSLSETPIETMPVEIFQ